MLEPISNLYTLRREALKDVRIHFAHDLSPGRCILAAIRHRGRSTALGKQAQPLPYSRIIGIKRVAALSSAPWSRTCSCLTK